MWMGLDEVEALASVRLMEAGATRLQAKPVARSIRLAERDGVRSHGFMYLPIYAEHLACGKVDGKAGPKMSRPRPMASPIRLSTLVSRRWWRRRAVLASRR